MRTVIVRVGCAPSTARGRESPVVGVGSDDGSRGGRSRGSGSFSRTELMFRDGGRSCLTCWPICGVAFRRSRGGPRWRARPWRLGCRAWIGRRGGCRGRGSSRCGARWAAGARGSRRPGRRRGTASRSGWPGSTRRAGSTLRRSCRWGSTSSVSSWSSPRRAGRVDGRAAPRLGLLWAGRARRAARAAGRGGPLAAGGAAGALHARHPHRARGPAAGRSAAACPRGPRSGRPPARRACGPGLRGAGAAAIV